MSKNAVKDDSKSEYIACSKCPKTPPDKANGEGIPILGRPIRIRSIEDARRLLSRLILEFQKGTVENRNAKDLCYLVISFVNIVSQSEIENRLAEIERRLNHA